MKKFVALLLFAVLMVGVLPAVFMTSTAQAAGETKAFYKVTTVDELVAANNSGGHFVIVTQSGGTYYSLGFDAAKNDALPAAGAAVPVAMDAIDLSGSNVFTLKNLANVNGEAAVTSNVICNYNGSEYHLYLWGGTGDTTSTPMFSDSASKTYSGIMLESMGAGSWKVWRNENRERGLMYSSDAYTVLKNGASEVEIWTDYESKKQTYVRVDDLSLLENFSLATKFLVVLPIGERYYAMGNKNADNTGTPANWLYSVNRIDADVPYIVVEENEYVPVLELRTEDSIPYTNSAGKAEDYEGNFVYGKYNGAMAARCDFGIGLAPLSRSASGATGYCFYPQYLADANQKTPFRSTSTARDPRRMQFEYEMVKSASGDYTVPGKTIFIRGNGETTYLGNADTGFTTVEQSSADRQPVEIYVLVTADQKTIYYDDTSGNVSAVDFVDVNEEGIITLRSDMSDIDGPAPEDWPTKGVSTVKYIFVGWSTDPTYRNNAFLNLKDSCNLYYFDYDKGDGRIRSEIALKYSLIGDCNPEEGASGTLTQLGLDVNSSVTLYPIYAVRGFNTIVPVYDSAAGKNILAVTGDRINVNTSLTNERWLGCIDVEVYKDGAVFMRSEPMYFNYHKDDTIDTIIKFLSDSAASNMAGFMASDTYPDPTREYVVDAVFAIQGGSQDNQNSQDPDAETSVGLSYKRNWIDINGGFLDNVTGRETIKLYLTTRYKVRYYLDDKMITDADWYDTEHSYATTQTMDQINKDFSLPADEYQGIISGKLWLERSSASDEELGLFDRFTDMVNESGFFKGSGDLQIERGKDYGILYFIKDYEHEFTVARSPEELIPAGSSLRSTNWELKKNNVVMENVDWGDGVMTYPVTTATTPNTFAVDGLPVGARMTYNLYAYRQVPQTGDASHPLLWLGMVCIGIIGFATRRRRWN